MIDDIDKMYLEKLDRIIQEKVNLSSITIREILLEILFLKEKLKLGPNGLNNHKLMDKYFNEIFKIYKDKISSEDLVFLCKSMDNEEICEKIIRKEYQKIRKEIRKTLYIFPSDSIWGLDIYIKMKFNHYEVSTGYINPHVIRLFYQYFGDEIKFLICGKIKRYASENLEQLDNNLLFYFFQQEIRKNNIEEIEEILKLLSNKEYKGVSLVNILSKSEWLNILKNKTIIEKILKVNIELYQNREIQEKTFQEAFLELLGLVNIGRIFINKIDVNKVRSIYSLEYFIILEYLSRENYNDNKQNYLFLMAFKIFFKEFLKKYNDKILQKDVEYLERIFRRAIQRKNIDKILLINNRKKLIHYYKSNDLLLNTSFVSMENIEIYNVKQYRNIKEFIKKKVENGEFINVNIFLTTVPIIKDEYIINSLCLFEYNVTKKLVNYNIGIWKRLVDLLKNKSNIFIDAFKEFVLEENDSSKILQDYQLEAYLSAFEKILVSNKKPTLNKMNKVIRSIKELLVPYNIHIEENLEQLNNVAKGDPFLEKINGIKLYEDYRKRIKSSIPNCWGEYHGLEYQLVNLHDKKIISNGIGKYLLPGNNKASSCLTPNGKAKTCLWHGAVNLNGRFFKVTSNGRIIAYSWVWRRGDILCFDNIELTEEIEKRQNFEKEIYDIYLQTAIYLMEKTKQEQNGGIKLVLIGRNSIDIKNKYIDNLESLKNIKDTMFQPTSEEEIYLKDSSENQVILYGEYHEGLNLLDVEPIYLYERPKVEKFKNLDNQALIERMNAIYYDYCLQHSIKYHRIKNIYISGYIGEDWFVGCKNDGNFDFFYNENDKRLFEEAKKFFPLKQENKIKSPEIYLPKYKIENILDCRNISVNANEIEDYLKWLNTHDYEIPNNYYSHSTSSIKNLNSIFKDGAITSLNYGKRSGVGGYSNGAYYICIARVGTDAYDIYKMTGTIILDDNMQIFSDSSFRLPLNFLRCFRDTSYSVREMRTKGEYQVRDIITKDHFHSLLATKGDDLTLAQVILLNEVYGLNLPVILEETMSKIDTDYVKKYIKIKN